MYVAEVRLYFFHVRMYEGSCNFFDGGNIGYDRGMYIYDMTRTHCPEQKICRYDSAGYRRVHMRRYISADCSSWTVDAFSSLGREDRIKSANPAASSHVASFASLPASYDSFDRKVKIKRLPFLPNIDIH